MRELRGVLSRERKVRADARRARDDESGLELSSLDDGAFDDSLGVARGGAALCSLCGVRRADALNKPCNHCFLCRECCQARRARAIFFFCGAFVLFWRGGSARWAAPSSVCVSGRAV